MCQCTQVIPNNEQYHFVIIDNFIGEPIMSELRNKCPNPNDKDAIEFSKQPIGENLAVLWNSSRRILY